MNTILIFDTETTGLPEWKKPSGDDCQPHIVQLAALQVDTDTRKIVQSMDVIVKPLAWPIPQEMTDIHGISYDMAMDVGVTEYVALDMFLSMLGESKRIAYNTTFDNRIIRIGTKRYFSEASAEAFRNSEYECAMIASRKIMGGKNPKLEDAYQHFTGKEMENAHNAMADTKACMDIFFAIKDLETEPEVA